MAIGERRQRILAAIVEAYIQTGEPIGSKALVTVLDNAVSSATIRNDMAELAAAGYLAQPHTSAGRLPTAAAFRLYLDGNSPRRRLSNERKRELDEALFAVAGDPERLLTRASELLAAATGVAAAAATPERDGARVRRVELLLTGGRSAAVLLMTDAGALRTRVCRLDIDPIPDTVAALSARLNAAFAGVSLSDIGVSAVQALCADSGLAYLPLLSAFLELVSEAAAAEVQLCGQLNLLEHPDYPPDRARSLLAFLSHRERLASLLATHAGGLRVVLGSESPRRELDGSSMIVTQYGAGEHGGTLCLIGPMRMDYAAAIPHLQHVAQTVSDLLSKGGF